VTIEFGDSQAEDAWDEGDDEEEKITILDRVVGQLKVNFSAKRRDDALRLVGKMEDTANRRALSADTRLGEIREALEEMG
jgi:hypothetical protein